MNNTTTVTYTEKSLKTVVELGTEFRCYNSQIRDGYHTMPTWEKMVEWVLTLDRMTGCESTVDFRVGNEWFRPSFINLRSRLHITELTRVYGF